MTSNHRPGGGRRGSLAPLEATAAGAPAFDAQELDPFVRLHHEPLVRLRGSSAAIRSEVARRRHA